MGISTSLYLPAIGTAGLLLLAVNGYNLDPAPPPNITANTDLEIADIINSFFERMRYNLFAKVTRILE